VCAGEIMRRGHAKACVAAAISHWRLELRGSDVLPKHGSSLPTEIGKRRMS
jgi:hypothetical protein